MLLAVAVFASAGCSSDKKTARSPRGTVEVKVGADGSVRGDVAGVATISGPAGSVAPGTVITAAPAKPTDVPTEVDGLAVSEIGEGLHVTVRKGRLLQPLTLTFAVEATPGETVVGLHRTDDGVFELLPAVRVGDAFTVTTDRFSAVSWIKAKLLEPIGDFLAEKLAGRTSPSSCTDAPAWATATANPSGSTHSCVRAGKALADGTAIAELEIKSNRGTFQWVELPATLPREYVWVEDQSDLTRSLMRKVWNRGDTVLLAPGQRMTVGYRQPVNPAQLGFRTSVDTVAGFHSLARLFVSAATDDALDKTGSYLVALKCFGLLKVDLTSLDDPVALKEPDLLVDLPKCVVEVIKSFADPQKAVAAASDILGSSTDASTLTELSQSVYKLGKLGEKLVKILRLASYILKELTFIVDSLLTGFGAANATTVTMHLLAKPAPPLPLLGVPGALGQYAEGFGTVRPKSIFYGGDPTGSVSNITWTSWGGPTAEGDGRAVNEAHSPDGTLAGAPEERAHVVAWDLGTCKGKQVYRKVSWYFAGQTWQASDYSYDLCNTT